MIVNKKKANKIRLVLKSLDVKFEKIGSFQSPDEDELLIEFKDSFEIDQLIHLLQRYKQEMSLLMPEYRRTF